MSSISIFITTCYDLNGATVVEIALVAVCDEPVQFNMTIKKISTSGEEPLVRVTVENTGVPLINTIDQEMDSAINIGLVVSFTCLF